MHNDTDEIKSIFARNYPHLAPLADELEEMLSTISDRGQGYGDVKLTSQGLDSKGRLLIKYIDAQVRRFRTKAS